MGAGQGVSVANGTEGLKEVIGGYWRQVWTESSQVGASRKTLGSGKGRKIVTVWVGLTG